ncbi:NAD-dependent epimerase/dehydratase family protein [Deinococcus sp.]|uniref:NAD-dependent epimerase/dehydratase family protein n=1 Tax=Deinococcus sp. TaxID=47478 RepID=UPI0025E66800|nr:NAD-dependent epimerase/dehydratase family protein [Deinococcus sp.]
MSTTLVIGALGQIGSDLVPALARQDGAAQVIAADVRLPGPALNVPFELLDCTDADSLHALVVRREVGTIYHLAALLSASAEERPHAAWRLNMNGLLTVLEEARLGGCRLFVPSSVAAFGPLTPVHAPQDTVQRPVSMYGVTKVSGELLCDYYAAHFGLDVRGLRYPGLISSSAPPGGGTTDYAVEIFHAALEHGHYTCFLRPDTRLPMMYMPDAIRATLELMRADPKQWRHRNAFNVQALSFTPQELADAIQRHLPGFTMRYEPDPVRQAIADSWPQSTDDSAARSEWGWQPAYDLERLCADMLERLRSLTPALQGHHYAK